MQESNSPMPSGRPWNPIWIGNPGRRLYAALHPAVVEVPACGVVLVPPLLHEQLRSRRMLAEIATRLSSAGVPCLRFDYFGSCDSEGSGSLMDLASMREDIHVSIDALRSRSGVNRVAVMAFRGGALPLASWLATGGEADPVVLWEPVAEGADWVEELADADARELSSPERYPLRRGVPVESSDRYLMGFEVSPRLRSDLASVRVAPAAWPAHPAVWGVVRPGEASLPLQRRFDLPASEARIGEGTRMDGALFVTRGIQQVVDALSSALAQPQQARSQLREACAT